MHLRGRSVSHFRRASVDVGVMLLLMATMVGRHCFAADDEWRKGMWISVTEKDAVSLGVGWDSANHIKTSSKCVTGKVYQEASQVSRIYSSAVQDLSQVAKQ